MSIKLRISIILTLSHCLFVNPAASRDTILQGQQPLRVWESLYSAEKVFRLQFFSPGTSKSWYLGIFHNTPSNFPDYRREFYLKAVWVANRDNPIADASGSIMIDTHGNLKITYSGGNVPSVFSSAPAAARNVSATLLDNGNFVLSGLNPDGSVNGTLWQSFDYPTDTLLPGMKLGIDFRTGNRWSLTSWISDEVPASGSFTIGGDPNGTSRLVLWWQGNVYRTSGPWINGHFVNSDSSELCAGFSYISNENEKYLIYSANKTDTWAKLVMDWDGYVADEEGPITELQNILCGNDVCTGKTLPECRKDDNYFFETRRGYLDDGYKPDGYHNMSMFDCWDNCVRNCSCIAYASITENGTGCEIWSEVKRFYPYVTTTSREINFLKKNTHKWWAWLIIALSGTILLAFIILCYLRNFRPKSEKQRTLQEFEDAITLSDKYNKTSDKIDKTMRQVHFLSFKSIAMATNNFSIENKLGEGGFGPVYKGKLPGGQEIAIKRLSRNSGQGLTEFKNEILLIAKVQHTNLVKLLGCSIEGQEKILIYEYMPNKSLDYFLFDHSRRGLLNWTNRLSVIKGVAQGLVYLHEYSRLKVIHRDLKASNILLDQNMNPKISDFGMARIFGATQSEANTNRIVGTYGYMSPEYAGKGIVSLKTDVFSFGVLVLEIVSGKKNYYSYDSEHSLNLIGFAWELWKEGRVLEVMDSTLDISHRDQMVRCINVGLLCVQDHAADRPSMTDVVSMLTNDSLHLSTPKQPAFYIEISAQKTHKEISLEKNCTNGLTMSVMEAR
ncbi:G-type lectin S-receptor-like serine threonine-kinase CES101 [Olea europaea subsp. europaea]|uniref:Receptor-like serine/threonine-protein kinase n=1 Tax=Olea europaea subsp. europaea TaxID=158383 RepID=A0A8S0S4J3_OLEEU|nr:G-type lectin S-receptor-like serine threonine-kinase CES101 [Olea europaea subsp. europaea]